MCGFKATVVPELELSPNNAAQFTLGPCGVQFLSFQGRQVGMLLEKFFRINLIEHHIKPPLGVVVHSHPYWLPKKNVVREELIAQHEGD